MHWKFQFFAPDPITGRSKKIVEIICQLYETCLEQESIYYKLYKNGHSEIKYLHS